MFKVAGEVFSIDEATKEIRERNEAISMDEFEYFSAIDKEIVAHIMAIQLLKLLDDSIDKDPIGLILSLEVEQLIAHDSLSVTDDEFELFFVLAGDQPLPVFLI